MNFKFGQVMGNFSLTTDFSRRLETDLPLIIIQSFLLSSFLFGVKSVNMPNKTGKFLGVDDFDSSTAGQCYTI
jgi:hypothetical protein